MNNSESTKLFRPVRLKNFCDFCVRLKPLISVKRMKKQKIIELAVKVLVAALTAFLTAIGTTSCMGYGPF